MFIDNWKVRTKILGVSIVLLLLSIAVAGVGYLGMNRIIGSMDTLYNTTVMRENTLSAIEAQLYKLDSTLRGVTMAGSFEEMEQLTEQFHQDFAAVKDTWTQYLESEGEDIAPELKERYDSLSLKLENYGAAAEEVLSGSVVMAMEMAREASAIVGEAAAVLDEISELSLGEARLMQEESVAVRETARRLLLFLSLAGTVFGILLSLWVALSVSNPLARAVRMLDEIASGNLAVEVDETRRKDEVGRLLSQLRQMSLSLRNAISTIADAADDVALGSEEVAAGVNQVGASVQEVAGTANQFASGVQQVTANTEAMEKSSASVVSSAEAGRSRLSHVVEKMTSIDQQTRAMANSIGDLQVRSQEIGDIVRLIVDIAGQTDLLALNAAIEAARAGDMGRGFAVVADEVRALAEQTSRAAGQISTLVKEIQSETARTVKQNERVVTEVQEGSQAVETTNDAFVLIQESIRAMVAQIGEVAGAAEQIGAGSQQIAGATEEQSASIQGIIDVTEQLADKSQTLRKALEAFTL